MTAPALDPAAVALAYRAYRTLRDAPQPLALEDPDWHTYVTLIQALEQQVGYAAHWAYIHAARRLYGQQPVDGCDCPGCTEPLD